MQEAVWQDLWQQSAWNSLEDLPSSPDFPVPHVPHNRSVIQMALAVADAFERFHGVVVDRDVLVAAGLLQDVSKLVEYGLEDGKVILTELGRTYPHSFWAAHTALARGLPEEASYYDRVRLGGQGPIFRSPAVADSGKVRLGGQGPIFR